MLEGSIPLILKDSFTRNGSCTASLDAGHCVEITPELVQKARKLEVGDGKAGVDRHLCTNPTEPGPDRILTTVYVNSMEDKDLVVTVARIEDYLKCMDGDAPKCCAGTRATTFTRTKLEKAMICGTSLQQVTVCECEPGDVVQWLQPAAQLSALGDGDERDGGDGEPDRYANVRLRC